MKEGFKLHPSPSTLPGGPGNRLKGPEKLHIKLSPGVGWEEQPPYAVVTSSIGHVLLV